VLRGGRGGAYRQCGWWELSKTVWKKRSWPVPGEAYSSAEELRGDQRFTWGREATSFLQWGVRSGGLVRGGWDDVGATSGA